MKISRKILLEIKMTNFFDTLINKKYIMCPLQWHITKCSLLWIQKREVDKESKHFSGEKEMLLFSYDKGFPEFLTKSSFDGWLSLSPTIQL